uniref:Multiple epidermal growth factor-like domains 10 n=1 Tax=Magallana gigas TaxID=29159 RepID=K1QSD4_MAGGI
MGTEEILVTEFRRHASLGYNELDQKNCPLPPNYTIEVGNSSKVPDRHVCASEHLPFIWVQYTVNVSCKPAVRGDIIIVKRVDSGSLILCDFKLREVLSFDGYNVAQSSISLTQNGPANALDNNNRSCAVTNYGKGNYWRIQFNQTLMVDSVELRLKGVCGLSTDGEPCPMCTVDSTCRHCDQSHYGASCEHKCSPGCVPGSCDELTGECNCTTGFTGTHCQFLEVLSFVRYNVSQSSRLPIQNGPENALDNSDDTCAVTDYGKGNYWRIQLNQTLTVDSMELHLKGVCGLSTDGEPCPMCTVDTTCKRCDQSHYGVSCEHNCSPGCVPGSCNELTGECNCITGFTGTHC